MRPESSGPAFRATAWAWIPAIAFTAFVAVHLVNFPSGDDFLSILPLASEIAERGLGSLRMSELVAQHFSHRILPVWLLTAGQMALLGQVNLVFFHWLSLLCWVGTFWILATQLRLRRRPLLLASAALAWFQPQASDNCTTAMQLANLVVLLAVVSALALAMSPEMPRQGAAWACGLLAFFTNANGLLALLLVLGLAVCVRSWKSFWLGLCLIPAALVFYFRGFVNPEAQTMALEFSQILGNFGVMMGGVTAFGPVPISFPLVAGWVLFGASGLAGLHWVRQRNFFPPGVLLFVWGSGAMAAWGRSGWGLEYMLQPRYMVYPLMLLLLLIAWTGEWKNQKSWLNGGIFLLASLFAALAWWQWSPAVINQGRSKTAQATSWEKGWLGLYSNQQEERRYHGAVLRRALELGAIQLPRGAAAWAAKTKEAGRAWRGEAEWSEAVAGYRIVVPREVATKELYLIQGKVIQQVGYRAEKRFAVGARIRDMLDTCETVIFPALDTSETSGRRQPIQVRPLESPWSGK